MRTTVALIFATILSTQSFANDQVKRLKFTEEVKAEKTQDANNPYFQIKSVKVQEISDEEALEFINVEDKTINALELNPKKEGKPNIPPVPPERAGVGLGEGPTPTPNFLDNIILIVDKLIAIGEKIMPAIERGRPVVNANPMAAVSVLPRIEGKDPALHDMGNWSIPVSKHYKISFTNGFSSEVVSFVYSISFQHSGSYQGKGKYLTGIRASAKNVNVSWGFDLDASSQLVQITNIGTAENMVAGATVEISYTVKNMMRNITTSEAFFVTGDGRLFKMD